MEPAIARSAVTNSALTRSDITCPRIARAEIARAEIARAEIARSAIARSAIARSDDEIGRVGQKGICQRRRDRPIVKRREIADGRQSYPSAIGERGTRESVIAAYSFFGGMWRAVVSRQLPSPPSKCGKRHPLSSFPPPRVAVEIETQLRSR